MKRTIAFVMVMIMTVTSFAGCASQPQATSVPTTAPTTIPTTAPTTAPTIAPTTSGSSVTIPTNLPKKVIGVFNNSFSDAFGSSLKTALEPLQSPFNVEFKFLEFGNSPDAGLSTLESGLQTGLDGVIISPSVAAVDAAKKAGNVPVAGMLFALPGDAENQLAQYDNYLGSNGQDQTQSAVAAADALYNAGCRKVAIAGLTQGISAGFDDRNKGFKDEVAKHPDMKIIAENYSMGGFDTAVQTFAASYPEMDGLYVTAGTQGVYQAMVTNGLVGKVKLATFDITDSSKDFFDNGTLVFTSAGASNSILMAFVLLYNYLYDGTKIDPGAKTVNSKMLYIYNSADLDTYNKLVAGAQGVYTPQEIAAMIKGFNPSFTPADFVKVNTDYSLEDIATRHSK